MQKLKVDLLTITAHKMYGPKGIGALYVRRKPRVRIEAQIHGGGHERGFRSGTLPTHQIVGFGEAARLAKLEMADRERAHPRAARPAAGSGITDDGGGVRQRRPRAPHPGQPQRQLQLRRGRVADHGDQGHRGVLGLGLHLGLARALLRAARAGRSDELAHTSIRFTLGRFTTEEEVDYAVEPGARRKVAKLRELSPLWEMYKEGVDLKTVQWAAH